MGNRVGGVLNITADGLQLDARGNFSVMASRVKRDGVAGVDKVHGFTEAVVVPSIKGDLTTMPGTSLVELEAIVNATVQISLANGRTYVLTQAWTTAAFEINAAEGRFGIEFQGITCEEI